jgi:cysteine-rich repeat protein
MRATLYLLLVMLSGCTKLIQNRDLLPCEGTEPRCDGNVLVQCAQNIQIRAECTQGSCDPVLAICVGVCGDGTVDPAEACDDGRNNSDITPNACRTDCTAPICGDEVADPEFGEDCDPPGKFACDDVCQEIVLCGDGFIRGDEQCDDGNNINGDDCKNDCSLNVCGDASLRLGVEECDDGNDDPTDFCTLGCVLNFCGDGFLFESVEDCEDGNIDNNDGCSDVCLTERCGDRVVQDDEECDDGNTTDTDACKNDCTSNFCGDGVVLDGVEECDDANFNTNDACTVGCTRAFCGDGFFFLNQEACEGNNLNNQTCTSQGFLSGDLSCSSACQFDTSACVADAACGNGVIDGSEECDDGNNSNTDACLSNCRIADCGDGFTQIGVEQCDDTNSIDTDACTSLCQFNICGDSVVFLGVEQCDDGNINNLDSCFNCQNARCGDGFVRQDIVNPQNAAFEECDDQNTTNTDGCLNTCRTNVCGDGVILSGVEECDDNNLSDGDGCEGDCTLPTGAICGDGEIEGSEECDDGNANNNDGCGNECTLEADIFVLCTSGQPTGDGSLADPFTSVSSAIGNNQNITIMILPQSPDSCGPISLNKSLIIQGLAVPDPTGAVLPPTINGGQQSAISVTAGAVVVRGLRLENSGQNSAVSISGNAKLVVAFSSISNTNGSAVSCGGNSSRFLLHQSTMTGASGGLIANGSCKAVIANSLLLNNGSAASDNGALRMEQTADVTAIFSTFVGNLAESGSVMSGCSAQRGKIDSSIIVNANTSPEDGCAVSFTNSFGASISGNSNLNVDPLFGNNFQLSAQSPCINEANPADITLPFEPLSVFNINVFSTDFANKPRIAPNRDMGMLEFK